MGGGEVRAGSASAVTWPGRARQYHSWRRPLRATKRRPPPNHPAAGEPCPCRRPAWARRRSAATQGSRSTAAAAPAATARRGQPVRAAGHARGATVQSAAGSAGPPLRRFHSSVAPRSPRWAKQAAAASASRTSAEPWAELCGGSRTRIATSTAPEPSAGVGRWRANGRGAVRLATGRGTRLAGAST
eukprot:scaffold18472_cov101-Isochrysis_galbana.AAC.4